MRRHVIYTCILYQGLFCIADEMVSYQGHQLWKVIPRDHKDLQTLRDLEEVKIWEVTESAPVMFEPHVFRVPETEVLFVHSFLSQRQLPFEVTVTDLGRLFHQHKRHKRSLVNNLNNFTYHEYHRYEEIVHWMELLAKQYTFISKVQIGVTYEGRPIDVLKIQKDPNRLDKPVVYLDALTHAREWISTASLMYLTSKILAVENQWMIDDMDWFIIPIVNVDGYVYTWNRDRNWRKTRSETATRTYPLCVGVDANRNWDNHWSEASKENTCTWSYHGAFPESESEVRHVSNFINLHKSKIKGMFSLHSYGQLILYPYGYKEETYTKDKLEQKQIGEAISYAMYGVHQVPYTVAQGAEGLKYTWSGTTMDWSYDAAGIKFSYTIELRDKGHYAFFLPQEQIVSTGEELFEGIKVFGQYLTNRN